MTKKTGNRHRTPAKVKKLNEHYAENPPTTQAELEAAVAEFEELGAPLDAGQVAEFAAKLSNGAAAPGQPRQLDPNRPMFHLVPPNIMQDLLEILQEMPYKKVHRVLPALMTAPLHQEPPLG